jgi:hypothetical protein
MIVLGITLLVAGLLLHVFILWMHPLDDREHPGRPAGANGLDGAGSGRSTHLLLVDALRLLRRSSAQKRCPTTGSGHSGFDPELLTFASKTCGVRPVQHRR